jgi:hypothetical protein
LGSWPLGPAKADDCIDNERLLRLIGLNGTVPVAVLPAAAGKLYVSQQLTEQGP